MRDQFAAWYTPSPELSRAKCQHLQEQVEKYPTAKLIEIEAALDEAAQQTCSALSISFYQWKRPRLHLNEQRTSVIAPKPVLENLD